MRIQQHHNSIKRRVVTITICIIVTLIICIAGYALYLSGQKSTQDSEGNDVSDTSKINLDEATDEEKQIGGTIKEETVNPDTGPKLQDGSSNLTATTNVTDSSLQVRTTISTIVQSGSCSLSLSKGTSLIEEADVSIQALSGYSTCTGWNVPRNKLTSGIWKLNITANYQSNKDTIEIEVDIP